MQQLLFSILICLFAVSCKESPSANPKHYRLALDIEANPNHVPLFVGKTLGYFEEEGIILDISPSISTNSLQLLENGQTDFAVSYLPKVLRDCAKNQDIYLVGKIIDKPLNGFVFLQSSGIKTHTDLNGRVVGYCSARYSLPIFEHLLSENNIQLGSKVHLGEDLITHLISKRIDAAYGAMQNVHPYLLECLGYKARFFSVTEFGMPEYEGLVVACSKAAKKDPKVNKGFRNALQKSIDFCRENPQIAFEMYVQELQKNSQATEWEKLSWQHTIPMLAQSQTFSYEKVKILADWLQDIGIMSKTINIDRVIFSMLTNEPSVS